MKKNKPDICLMEINTQASIELSEEDLNDIHSAIGFSIDEFPTKDAKDFIKNLKSLNKKFWKFFRKIH